MNKLKRQPKLPKQTKSESLQDFFKRYNSTSLVGLLDTLERSEAWFIFKAFSAYVQRQYEVSALDKTAKEESGAAYASGYAKCAEDIQENFMEGLRKTILHISEVVENPRPEDEE